MKDPVKDKLKRFGLFTRFGEQTFFATLGEAVSAYRETSPRVDRLGGSPVLAPDTTSATYQFALAEAIVR